MGATEPIGDLPVLSGTLWIGSRCRRPIQPRLALWVSRKESGQVFQRDSEPGHRAAINQAADDPDGASAFVGGTASAPARGKSQRRKRTPKSNDWRSSNDAAQAAP